MKKEYNNILYAFDIETTTTPAGVVAHYLSNFLSVDFRHFKDDKNNIIKHMQKPFYCRTALDINNYLIDLNNKAEEEQKYYIIYIHNFAYEFDYLIRNVDFVKSNFRNDNSLFLKPRIPLFVRIKNLEFRCSYKLLNQSISKIGSNLGYEKLEIDYSKQYFEFSVLPDEEYKYNLRDTEITLLGVLKECSNWEYIKTVNDIPLTATSFSRKNNDYINTTEDIKRFTKNCYYQKYYNKEFIEFLEKIYQGGYTHANAFYVGKALKNITSVDIVSSYPHSMLHRQYPAFFTEFKGKYINGYFQKLISLNKSNYKDVFNNYNKPFSRAFLSEITIKNVQAKILKNNNLILPISLSKCTNYWGVKLDNGRIFSAKQLTIYVNEIDYWILEQFYNFEVAEVLKLYITKTYKNLDNYIMNSVRQYLDEKSTIKNILHKIDKGQDICYDDFYNERKKDYIFSDLKINNLISDTDFENLINVSYRVSKNRLNAQYGQNVQKLMPVSYQYDVDEDVFTAKEEEKIQSRILKRDFIKGLYITSYSRLTLFVFALYLIDNSNSVLIYSDTDSWKIKGNSKQIKELTNEYNKKLNSIINNHEDYNIGSFDVECVYKGFSTLGCKKYICEVLNPYTDENEIKITIAGVSKKDGSKAYTDLYYKLYNDFDLLVKYSFTPNTILHSSIINKKIIKYHNENYNCYVTDENGKSEKINGINMCELVNSDFILMNTKKPLISNFIDYCEELQKTVLEYPNIIFYRDEFGEVNIKNISDWKEALKLYDTIDIDKYNTIDFEG